MKITKDYLKRLFSIFLLEAVTLCLLIIALTLLRFATPDLFSELQSIYEKYALVETDISLVLGGEDE